MTDPDLIRFLDAHASIYPRVVEELSNGRKKTHWMWFIFPHVRQKISIHKNTEFKEEQTFGALDSFRRGTEVELVQLRA